MIGYFQHQSKIIADVRLPSAMASASVVNGIDNSNSQLRSWVLLRNQQRVEDRRRAWDKQIDPALDELEALATDVDLATIESLRATMASLRESQWWVEDIAAAVGNDPALLIYERDLLPNFEQIQSAVAGLKITGANSKNISDIQVATALTHQSLSEVIRQLSEAVRTGGIAELKNFRDGSNAVRLMLGELSAQIDPDNDAAQLLGWITLEYRTYEELANQTIAIRQSDNWNRALYILNSETEPIVDDIKQVLLALRTEHNDLLQKDISRSALISRVGTFVTLSMIIGLALIAWAVARSKSERLVAPIKALAAASEKIATSEDRPEQLPINGPLEIAHLTERFNYMSRELATRTKDLRHANKELQAYTHIITHDLKPPLINIKGHAGLIKTRLQSLENTAQDQHLAGQAVRDAVLRTVSCEIPESVNYIDLSISKMKTLVDGVFDNSKLLFRSVSREKVDTDMLVTQVLALFSHRSGDVDVVYNSLPVICTDTFLMEHIFSNLIDNALKYLDPGRPGRIEIGGRQHEGEAHFYIKDNGIGLSDTAIDVFKLFRQVDPTKTGRGVGLALVETMLSKLGGRIWYKSNGSEGVTFFFSVPTGMELTDKNRAGYDGSKPGI
jgi:signal transduction histidine kinase